MELWGEQVDFGKYANTKMTFFDVACEHPGDVVALRGYDTASARVAQFLRFTDAMVEWLEREEHAPVETLLWKRG